MRLNQCTDEQRPTSGYGLVQFLLIGLCIAVGLQPAMALAATAPTPAAQIAQSTANAAVVRTEQIARTAATAHELVEQSTKALIEFIDQAKPYAKVETDRYYKEVEALLAPVVDFQNFSRGVMAAYYKSASPEQRERFRDSFKWGLVKTYSLALTEFNDGEVVVLPPDRESDDPKRQRVKMEIRTPAGEVYPVVYALRQGRDNRWLIYNLVVNGVNMGLTFRSQFASAMNDRRYAGDLDQVIQAWASVVEESDSKADADKSSAG